MHIFLGSIFNADGSVLLSPEESNHCIKVLRHKTGDLIHIIDGKGNFYEAELTSMNPAACVAKIKSKKNISVTKPYSLHIAISPTKNADRIEWMLEKCTELGVDEFSFILCKRTEKLGVKTDRLKKIAESAVKQSIQGIIPVINEPLTFKEFILLHKSDEKKFIAHCLEETPDGRKIDLKNILPASGKNLILIGPEGDFTPEEIKLALENGFTALTLGEARLRTETAGLFVAAGFKATN